MKATRAILPAALIASILASLLLQGWLFGFSCFTYVSASPEEYTYYGYVPPRIWRVWNPTFWQGEPRGILVGNESISTRGILAITGNHDGTKVKVYTTPGMSLVQEYSMDKLDNVLVYLPNGTFFKVVSDKVVTVMLMGGIRVEKAEATGSSFMTSTEGGFVGREFIFLSLRGVKEYFIDTVPPGFAYAVYALEDSDVTIYENGSRLTEFKLSANQVREVQLKTFYLYDVVSTGRIMVETFFVERSLFFPSAQGGFLGTRFHGSGIAKEEVQTYDPRVRLVATGTDDLKMSVVNIDYRRKALDVDVSTGTGQAFQVDALHLIAESNRPALLMHRSDDDTGGVAFAGLKGGQTAYIQVPEGESYIFSRVSTVVTIDDVQLRLPADGMATLTEGLHKVSADQDVVIQVVQMARNQGIETFGACVPSAQAMGMTYEGLSLKPPLGEELPWMYIAAVAVVAVVAIIVWQMRRRGKRQP